MVLLERFYNEEVVLGGADLAPGAADALTHNHASSSSTGGSAKPSESGEKGGGGGGGGVNPFVCPAPGDHAAYLAWCGRLPLGEVSVGVAAGSTLQCLLVCCCFQPVGCQQAMPVVHFVDVLPMVGGPMSIRRAA